MNEDIASILRANPEYVDISARSQTLSPAFLCDLPDGLRCLDRATDKAWAAHAAARHFAEKWLPPWDARSPVVTNAFVDQGEITVRVHVRSASDPADAGVYEVTIPWQRQLTFGWAGVRELRDPAR